MDGDEDRGIRRSSFLRVRLSTLMLMVFAFALGLAVRNIADGLHPLTMSLSLPKSTSPLRPGDTLLVECLTDPSINRQVTVLADLTISLPLVGEVSVKGDTVKSLEQSLRTKYGKYFATPVIQVYRADASVPMQQ